MINENNENVHIELNEELINNENDNNLSVYKFYILSIIFFLFILTFITSNKDKLKYEINKNNIIKKTKKNIPISNTRVGLCVIGKKENLYAKEFVDYYKNLGYNHIFIYDNNDVNDEKFEDVLSQEISENFVTIINYRGYRGKSNRPQFDAYKECYANYSTTYDWLSFYDFDEFLFLKEHKNIQEFLDQDKFKKCINIKINWLIYSDNDLIYYEDKPVQERFTTPILNDTANKHIKSTVRGHLKNNYWNQMRNPHSSKNNYVSCIPTGDKTSSKSPFHSPPNYEVAYIKHYLTKSLEEFLEKAKRGRPDMKVKINKKMWKGRFEFFFSINKKTKEKVDYFKKKLNINIS